MKKSVYLSALITSCLAVIGCSKQTEVNVPQQASEVAKTVASSNKSSPVFSVDAAKENLTFAKDQYLKLLDHALNERHLHPKPACIEDKTMICVPRSEEHGGIFMEEKAKWTNGFFPGAIWKILSAKQHINWANNQEQTLFDGAKYYQQTLFSEAKRGSTHDLGFILYDSFGEALNYDGLDDANRKAYVEALETGRATLATRYRDEKGLIRSWDWIPRMRIKTIENGEKAIDMYTLSNPWTYPVIVDNMMNLEFLFASDSKRYHEIAFNHAKHTSINHYFYDESDTNKQYPLSYHVFDYGAHKPGNWQGIGNVSAWARGQGWSLYGFVTVVEAMQKANIDLANYPDFHAHLQRVFGSVEHLLQDGYVPYWDFFAARDNAYEIAENISSDTTVFHGVLALCGNSIEDFIKPYEGYRPMTLNASMLSDESLARLKGKESWYGEPVIQGDKLLPCGTKPYPKSHKKIPRDTSAAAIYAAAMYRYATFTKNQDEKKRYSELADKIMAELSTHYRTDRSKNGRPNSYDFGFVLAEATGDMGNGGEIDTPIIYGDFYFIEANVRKIEFQNSLKQ
ncbi:hypothetical protein C2869_03410 [Saccharobesus litoralis]|uniref:Uncharacterized protein n=1 Tax=Saccharobesus litoralis TaxID=2172099 RepID=A0A2S0VMY6_9ALTE|nr:glycoside hydrolase family 88 protein [Saccharobesus litoralis]AWB65539.1 hypothetical protein C2869_03410 [Saccharobesus litoralis]